MLSRRMPVFLINEFEFEFVAVQFQFHLLFSAERNTFPHKSNGNDHVMPSNVPATQPAIVELILFMAENAEKGEFCVKFAFK